VSIDREAVDLRRLLIRAAAALLVIADGGMTLLAARSPMSNSDTYFHLRFGEEFWHHWSIAHPGQPNAASSAHWVPTQWLGELLWYGAYEHGGAAAMGVLYAVLLVAVVTATYAAARTVARPVPSLVAASAAFLGSQTWDGLRPQLMSYALIALTVAAWNRARRDDRTPWLLIPMTWLWAMCHGMWVLGVAISVVAVLGLAFENHDLRLIARRAAVPVGSIVVAMLTPVGPRLVTAVAAVSSRGGHFAEWTPTPLLHGWGLPVTAVLAVTLVLRLRRGATPPYPLLMLGLAIAFALYSGRTVTAALIVAAPLLAAELSQRPRITVGRRELGALGGLTAVTLLCSIVVAQAPGPGLTSRTRPFDDDLDALPAGTVVLTDRSDGALLLWTHPDLEVPMHGYGDVFTDAELDRYDDLSNLQPGWIGTLDRLGARYALLEPDAPLAYALVQRGWKVARTTDALELLTAAP